MGLIIFLILFGLCFFSVPIAASIGFSSIAGLLLSGYTLQTKNVYADRFLFYACHSILYSFGKSNGKGRNFHKAG